MKNEIISKIRIFQLLRTTTNKYQKDIVSSDEWISHMQSMISLCARHLRSAYMVL